MHRRSLATLTLLALVTACSSQVSRERHEVVAAARAVEEYRDTSAAPAQKLQRFAGPFHTEAYARIDESEFLGVAEHPLSTFSVDVDTASYANVRRFLAENRLPPADAVRIEELVNYFPYAYEPPAEGAPFAVHTEVMGCPWEPSHRLVRIGLKAKEIPLGERPPSNLVFLVDVSGSMQDERKLPLVKSALRLLVERLDGRDRVALVVYAGSSGVVLPGTAGDRKTAILAAIDRLEAGGSTNGGAGIELAYALATEGFVRGGTTA